MKKVCITNGSGGCGKDTFANLCKKYVSVYKYSSIDWIKEIAGFMGWEGKKDEKDRTFLSDLKILSSDYNNMPFCHTVNFIVDYLSKENDENSICFIDIREPNEIQKVVDYFKDETKIETILITNKNVPVITTNEGDAGVFDYNYDYYIENNGTLDDLKETVQTFIEELFSPKCDKECFVCDYNKAISEKTQCGKTEAIELLDKIISNITFDDVLVSELEEISLLLKKAELERN